VPSSTSAQLRTPCRRLRRRTLVALGVALVALVVVIGPFAGRAHAQEAPVIPSTGATEVDVQPEDGLDATADAGTLPAGDPEAAQAADPADSAVTDAPLGLVKVPEVDEPGDVAIDVTSDDSALSRTVVIVILMTVGSVAPAILLLMTSFTRFVIVLGLTRQAIGAPSIPPNQVLVGLAMFLTFFVMNPVISEINETAVQPMLRGEIEAGEALSTGFDPLREFMLAQTDEDDLRLFMRMSGEERPETPEDVSAATLVPAYVISELRTAMVIGFVIFVPFLIVDLVVSSVLMSMGMVMLPPAFISLPLKLLLFVLVDGWGLIIGSVVQSVHGVPAVTGASP
jgi:flagellar biosynthesis protein FliP